MATEREETGVFTAPRSVAVSEHIRLQSARGLACLLLVAFHVIGGPGTDGLQLPADSLYQLFTQLFIHLRMPLFAFLSGFVYAYRPATFGDWRFMGKKFKRLAIPLLAVTTLYSIMLLHPSLQIVPGSEPQTGAKLWLRHYLFGYHHLWFLQSILLIFAATVVLEKWMGSFRSYLVVLACAWGLYFFYPYAPYILSINGFVILLPLFLLGLGANRFREQFWAPRTRTTLLAVFVISAAIYAGLIITGHSSIASRASVIGGVLSGSGCLFVLYWIPQISWLAWIGNYSFGIYLYHYFFTVFALAWLNATGIGNIEMKFIVALLAGLLGPVLLEILLRPNAFTRRLFLGQS